MNEQTLKTDMEKAMEIGLSREHTSGEPVKLRPAGAMVENDPQHVQKMLASTDRMLRSVRKSILDAEMQYQQARALIVERAEDELARMRTDHDRRMADLDRARRKIEAMRDA